MRRFSIGNLREALILFLLIMKRWSGHFCFHVDDCASRFSSLKRADVIVLTGGASENLLKELIGNNLLKENCVIIEARTVAGEFYNMFSRREFFNDPF